MKLNSGGLLRSRVIGGSDSPTVTVTRCNRTPVNTARAYGFTVNTRTLEQHTPSVFVLHSLQHRLTAAQPRPILRGACRDLVQHRAGHVLGSRLNVGSHLKIGPDRSCFTAKQHVTLNLQDDFVAVVSEFHFCPHFTFGGGVAVVRADREAAYTRHKVNRHDRLNRENRFGTDHLNNRHRFLCNRARAGHGTQSDQHHQHFFHAHLHSSERIRHAPEEGVPSGKRFAPSVQSQTDGAKLETDSRGCL